MKRLTTALLAVLALPPLAHAVPTYVERPPDTRHAINAVLGDISYVTAFGAPPPPDTDADARVRIHLEFVHRLLAERDVSHLPGELQSARANHLQALRAYIDAGIFPRNHRFPDQNRPCFIDRDGRVCAVGYLVEQSAGTETAEAINARYRDEFLWNMHLPELDRWIEESGLSLRELSMIQPTYDPEFILTFEQDSDVAPATVHVTGNVYDWGGYCGTADLRFETGGNTIWVSPLSGPLNHPVDFEWTFLQNGFHQIVGKATAPGYCGSEVVVRNFYVVVGSQPLPVSAVISPSAPYEVYLETSEPVFPRQGATVDWGDGNPPQAVSWWWNGERYRSTAHTYVDTGEMMVIASIEYSSGPPRVGAAKVNLGPAVAVEETTWGRVKALFR
jgi:hypothetical protein